MASFRCPAEWEQWVQRMATGLHGRSSWRLAIVITGMLFARGRRTVTTWLRAVGVGADYADYYYFLESVGRNTKAIATQLLAILATRLPLPERVLLVIDDSPTHRYGPQVEGADIHHNPTPGPADQMFLYGHIWVTLSLAVRHAQWGTIGLPLLAFLYVRQRAIPPLDRRYGWKFRTKLELAERLLAWCATFLKNSGKTVWIAVDGFYAKRRFLTAAIADGITVVSRLRRDAALRDLPRKPKCPRRGRPRKYGENKISLAGRAAHPRGWQTIECFLYGQRVVKTYKTFLATWAPAGGVIRVVIVRDEKNGCQFFFCTDPDASVAAIIEAFADRSSIEQDFHDVKEIWGAGKQQVRRLWRNIACFNLNLWVQTLLELWAWDQPKSAICDRTASPWDDPARRPSHADRRKAMCRQILDHQFSSLQTAARLPQKIIDFTQTLIAFAQ